MDDYPKKLYYMIDIICNERCSKCHHWMNKTQKTITDMNLISNFANEIQSLEELILVGGEPLIYKEEIKQIINQIANSKVRTVIITNGVLASEDLIDFIADKNVHLIFSIDTLNSDKWRYVRGTDSKEKVMKNFAYARKKLAPVQLSVQSVLADETQKDVLEVGTMLASLGIYHSIQHYISSGFEGQWTSIVSSSPRVNESECSAYESNMSIMPNGDIYTCFQQNTIPNCEVPLGNIADSTFHEISSSSYLSVVRKKMKHCNYPCRVLKCNIREFEHESI